MLNVRLAGDHLYGNCCSPGCRWYVFDGVFLCCSLSHEMSWMRSGTVLSPFLRGFLPTHGTVPVHLKGEDSFTARIWLKKL